MSPLMAGLMTTPFAPCRPQMALQGRYLAPKAHSTTCRFHGTAYRISSRFFGLRLRVSSDGHAWTPSGGPGKRLKGPRRMMTLADPAIPPVYSLHYAQQGRHDQEDELPREPMG